MEMKRRSVHGGKITEITASMRELVAEAVVILQATSSAFRQSRLEGIRNVGLDSSQVSITCCGLINSVLELGRSDDSEKKALIGAIGNLERICASIDEMAGRARTKIERDILFSIQAFGECNELFTRSIGILDALGKLLGGEVEYAELEGLCRELERLVYESEMRHEERLIKGVCAVKSSDLFIGMLDLFRAIAFHSSQAAASLKQGKSG